ncbi:zinc finger protein ZFP2 [Anabrus simplex]|uniref:zinc finger protein ZFP2 n=1 Tax=Anabrus simplex TaxID=316456 RepID=UPI0035A3A871
MDCSGDPEDDSEFDRVTQILPECFVSVKLESNEDNSEKLSDPSTCHTASNSHLVKYSGTESSKTSVMQNLQQHSVTSAQGVSSAHCFRHHHGSSMPELPPWLSHCYTSQINPECSQSSYLTQDGSLTHQGERLLKSGCKRDGSNVLSGTNGVSNGDTCDSNTFLNYVLNQQLSGSIFFFDSTRSSHSSEEHPESTSGVNNHCNSEAAQHSCDHENSTVSSHKNTQTAPVDHSCSTCVTNRERTHCHKIIYSPCPVSRNDSGEQGNESSSHTASKYSQTIPYVSVHQDAKTNTGDNNDSDSSSKSSKEKDCVLSPCSKCVHERNMHCCLVSNHNDNEEMAKVVGNTCIKCNFISHSGLHYSCLCCSRNSAETKQTGEEQNLSDVDNAASPHTVNSCHNLCTNCSFSSDHGVDSNIKSESVVSHCVSGMKKLSVQHSNLNHCKVGNDGGRLCTKSNRRLHYGDVDRPYTCEICFKNYPSSTALMNHTRYHRGERPYQCETCNKAFATNSHLVTHRRVHTGERPFQCQLCRRSFADRSAFVKHERTHGPNGTIIKRYKCEECGNAFVDSCGLKKHIRIHTGERPYQCSVCEKSFSTSSTFVAHKRIHSGERPYKCEQCTKMFITKSHLLTHRRTHTGEKPFTCQVCSRAFADGSSFRRHERLHTGENRHICDVCGKGFPFDTSLAKHKQSHIPGSATYVYMV